VTSQLLPDVKGKNPHYKVLIALMTPHTLLELLNPYLKAELSERQAAQFLAYLELLLKWNAKTNLTAIRDPEQIVQRHFGESLALAAFALEDTSIATAADLGSGAGFPGLPLAIYAPQVRVTLIESQNKKTTFLKEVARALELPNLVVLNQRGEQVQERFDLLTLRAVEKFEAALKLACSLTKPQGRIALLISANQLEVVQQVCNTKCSTQEVPSGTLMAVAQLP
jgi:16S rRNA (guanine527-N7)-methyltransferase